MKKIKAYLTYWLTGWKSVDVFGNPGVKSRHYIVCLKNTAVMDGIFNSEPWPRWWHMQHGDFKKHNTVVYYREMPKPPRL